MDGGWAAVQDDAAALFGRGNALAGRGQYAAAAEAYRAALARRGNWPEAWTNLGTVLAAAGHKAAAIAAQRMALRQAPGEPVLQCNLGNVLHQAGRWSEAAEAYRAALARHPTDAVLQFNLGNALTAGGDTAGAAAAYEGAVAADPGFAAAQFALGMARQAQGRLAEAEAAYEAAAGPASDEAQLNLGNVRLAQGRVAAAVAAYRALLARRPDHAPGWCNLGAAWHAAGRFDTAIVCTRQALALNPAYADAHSNLGNALAIQGEFAAAVAAYRAAIEARPDFAAAWANLGATLRDLGRLDEAEHALRTALELAPGSAEAIFNLGLVLLTAGRFATGWALHEARWRTGTMPRREFLQKQWHGEPPAGRTILLHAEQGLGDTLQFVRYAPLLAASGARVLLEVPATLVPLLAQLPDIAAIIAEGAPLPAFDLHCPMMSLPLAFATTLETIPSAPYLAADPARTARWRDRLPSDGRKVGLVWAGSPRIGEPRAHHADRRRSIPLAAFAPLAEVPGVRFVSLQKDAVADPAAASALGLIDMMDQVTDFADTAALVAALDLVIAVDTSVAHLAAAMGKPVWLLSRFDGCWRWLAGRTDSPWYPSLRLFRQGAPGEWAPVIARVRAALAVF